MRVAKLTIFALVFAGFVCGWHSSETSTGDSGKADFAYSDFVFTDKIDQPMLTGDSAFISIKLHSEIASTAIRVATDKPDVVAVDTYGRGTSISQWSALVNAKSAGSAKLQLFDSVTNAPIDTITIDVADAAKIDAPSSVSMSIGDKKQIETHVKDATGRIIRAFPDWTLDQDFAVFMYATDQQGQTHGVGNTLIFRGNHAGTTTLHGRLGKVAVDLQVSVQ